MENTKKENVLKRFASAVGGNNLVLIGAIIVVFILFTAINPNYLTWTNFVNLLVAASLVGIVAVGHTYLIIAGQNDLSPGSLCAFCGVAVAGGKGACTVQMGGFVTVPYSDTVPTLGYTGLAADGTGGVKTSAEGTKYWVVARDSNAKTVTILL